MATLIFFLFLAGILFSIGATIIVIVAAIGIIVGGMTLLQLLVGALIQRMTGRRPKWVFSQASFILEGILVCVFFAFWFTTPVTPLRIPGEDCTSIGVSDVGYIVSQSTVTHPEQVDAIVDALEACMVKQRINIRFMNEGMVDGNDGTFLTFYDSEGNLLRKVRITADHVGIAKKDKGDMTAYTYYRTCEETDLSALYDAIDTERELQAREKNSPLLDEFFKSWQFQEGSFRFYNPDWNADFWNLSIRGTIPNTDGRAWIETQSISYLEEEEKRRSFPVNETISFAVEDAPHIALTCTLYLDGAAFEYDLLPLLDEAHTYREGTKTQE